MKTESPGDNLSRFLIAFDELRARLAPSKYPNLEISDEGCLWFNVDTSIGTAEIVGVPFEFKEIKAPSIIVSFPREAKDVELNFLRKLLDIAANIYGTTLLAGTSASNETLKAYRENIQPPLTIAQKYEEILDMKKKGVFFNYLGILFEIDDKKVSEVENIIKHILFKIEAAHHKTLKHL